jgi:hypothetical protein
MPSTRSKPAARNTKPALEPKAIDLLKEACNDLSESLQVTIEFRRSKG